MSARPTYEELQERVKSLEQRLQKQERGKEKRLNGQIGIHSLFETDIVAYSITRLDDGVYLEANPGFQSMSGYSRDEIIGNTSRKLGIINAQRRRELLDDLKSTGHLQNREISFISKNGDAKTALISISEIHFRNEKCLYTTLVDISDRKEIEEQIRESELLHRLTLSNVNDTVILTDEEGRMTFCCPNVHFITGYTDREVMTWDNVSRLVGEQLYDEEILKQSGELQNIEKDIVTKNGDICHTLIGVKKIRFKNSTRLYTVHDITELKKLQNNLIQSQKMESLGNLAGGIAHDFNNLLSAIIGFTELSMVNLGDDTTIKENLQEVCRAGFRAKDLVQQILTFTRQQDTDVKPVKLSRIVVEAIKFLRSSLPSTIQINTDVQSDSHVLGSEVEFHQIIMNLCTNAAQAMGADDGILELTLKDIFHAENSEFAHLGIQPGPYVEVAISDTGRGIPQKYIDRVFEQYFTTKALGEGTGMGLSLVHSLVESYGGKVFLHSVEGAGTTVRFYLPIVEEEEVQDSIIYENLPQGNEKILFVEDEPTVVKVSTNILQRLGYTVITASHGQEALNIFQAKKDDFDLVITDLTMPHLKGDELAVELLKIRPEIPIILLTGNMHELGEQDLIDIGIRAVHYKPVTKKLLAHAVRKVLDDASLLDSIDPPSSSCH